MQYHVEWTLQVDTAADPIKCQKVVRLGRVIAMSGFVAFAGHQPEKKFEVT